MNCNVGCGCSYIIGLFKSFKRKPAPPPEPPKPVTPVVPTPTPQPVPQPQPEKDRNVVNIYVDRVDADGCSYNYSGNGDNDNGGAENYLNSANVWVNYRTINAAGETIESKRERKRLRGDPRMPVDANCGKAVEATLRKFMPNKSMTVDTFNRTFN